MTRTATFRRVGRSRSIAELTGTVVAVVAVHATAVSGRLVFDDYFWLDQPPLSALQRLRTFVPSGDHIYRPLLATWFATLRPVFHTAPLPYHLANLAVLVVAALAVRWLALRLGVGHRGATAAGIVVGTDAALTVGIMWASVVLSLMAIACTAAAVALTARPGTGSRIGGVALLVVAVMWRDGAVVAAPVATVLLAAAPPPGTDGRTRITGALRATVGLWGVAVVYGGWRLAGGLFVPSPDQDYRFALGGNLVRNLLWLLQDLARFGIPAGALPKALLDTWTVVFWVAVGAGTVWAWRRGSRLVVGGLLATGVGLLPVVAISSRPMDTYYVDFALIGLAVALGAMVDVVRWHTRTTVAVGLAFVVLQFAAARVVWDHQYVRAFMRRADVLEDYARHHPPSHGTLVVEAACPMDAVVTRDGAMFRVLLAEPDLRVRFDVLADGTAPSTRWGCRPDRQPGASAPK